MALKQILINTAIGTGYTQYQTDTNMRNLLLMRIQQAADEIYEKLDLPGSLNEITARVSTDMLIALPPFVGLVRAMKEHDEHRPWKISDLRPRYHHNSWDQEWKNFRQVGHRATQVDITNQAGVTVQIAKADSSLVVTIVGKTLDSDNTREEFTMDETSKTGTVSFNEIRAVQLNKTASYDVSVYDADGNLLSIVYNSFKTAQYIIYDVSKYPEIGSCDDGTFLMDILYKNRLIQFQNDWDEFPVPGYDDNIALKAIEIDTLYQPGKEDRSDFLRLRNQLIMTEKQGNATGVVAKKIHFEPRPLNMIFRRGLRYSSRRKFR